MLFIMKIILYIIGFLVLAYILNKIYAYYLNLNRKKLPFVSEEEFITLLKKPDIPNKEVLHLRRVIADILSFPEEKLSPDYSMEMLEEYIYLTDWDFEIIERYSVDTKEIAGIKSIRDLLVVVWKYKNKP